MEVNVKIALIQSYIFWEDKDRNMELLKKIIDKQYRCGVKLFLLPEMSFTGFTMNTDDMKENDKFTVGFLEILAKEYNVAIGAGWIRACEGKCENHYSIVTPEGEIADYGKIHPFTYGEEDDYYKGCNSIVKCEFEEFKMGIQICYDMRFQDIFMKAAKDVDLVIVPANWPAARAMHWNTLLRARAIENQVYVAGVNCAGNINGLYYSGDSQLINPDGKNQEFVQELISEYSGYEGICREAKVLIYNIENDVNKYREDFPVLRDRREI